MRATSKFEKLEMDRVYKRYKEMKANPQKLMDELGIDLSAEGDSLGTAVVRKETDLNNEEKQYLLAIERGDIPTVRHFLEESQIYFNININCVDPLGRSALLIAIENENIELMELLLVYNVELGDCLLHAISEENVEAVEILLAHQNTNKKDLSKSSAKEPAAGLPTPAPTLSEPIKGFKGLVSSILSNKQKDGDWYSVEYDVETTALLPSTALLGGVPSSSFTQDITPIILAAHRDNYEILKILLDRGDSIPKPHDVRCNCTDCVTKSNEDSLNHSRSRINAYRALSSPSLIAQSSKDPILTAFELSWELKRLSRLENEFKVEYEELYKQCQDFAVSLLDQTRGSKELECVLNYDPNGPVISGENEKMHLSRLKLAIKYKQKRFVSHPNCQQLLASLWYEGLPGFRRRHIVFKVLLAMSVCLLYPVLSIFYIIAPKCSIGLFMRRPFIKFICHSASYMTFLFLLILASQRIDSIISFGDKAAENTKGKMTREVRGALPTSIEWMILAYVTGLIWAEIKQLWDVGAKAYVQDMWNILDFITNSLYIATFTLKLVAYLRVEDEKRNGDNAAYARRDQWDAYDPNLIAEGLFATANIFSSLKLIYIFTVNPHLGPLQISLGRMVMDIMRFGFIAILVLISYACGINQLYWYYAEARQSECKLCMEEVKTDPELDCSAQCDRTLANLFEILQTLYFAVYGLVEIKHFELNEDHEFTQFVGKLMFGSYCAIMIVVLLNMLIAMLSTSYQSISSDADSEWKYARSKLWMSFFEEGGTVPPPCNIIPTPKSIWYMLVWLKDKLCHCSQRAKRNKWQSIRKVVKRVNERDARYQLVMRDLVKRYVMQRQRTNQTEGVTEDDLNEIKQDISSFRYELLEILRSNGMKTPNYSNQQKGKKMRRKGSRMSMERMQRQMTPTPTEEESTALPKFLEKTNSIGSKLVSLASRSSKSSGLGSIGEEDTDSKKDNSEKEGSGETDEKGDGEIGSGNSEKCVSGSTSRDEGLGESFDQQSEMSDSSQSIRAANGFNGMDPLPEERVSDSDSLHHDLLQEDNTLDSGNSELALDPTKLPDSESTGSLEGNLDYSPFDKKVGSIKKVSFLGSKEAQDEDSETIEPISDTYVYDGRKKSKSKFGLGKSRSKKKE